MRLRLVSVLFFSCATSTSTLTLKDGFWNLKHAVRAPLIEERLRLIEVKGRDEIVGRIRETYEREASRQTWCVGVNWGKYGMEELMEIGECLGSKALVVLLKVLSEQWGYRSGGVPDLW